MRRILRVSLIIFNFSHFECLAAVSCHKELELEVLCSMDDRGMLPAIALRDWIESTFFPGKPRMDVCVRGEGGGGKVYTC